MTVVYAYAKTSVDDGIKVSVEAQLNAIHKQATREGLPEAVRFSDKGVSGVTDKRPSFKKLKQLIANTNEVGILYVWRYDRIARNTTLLLTFLSFCQQYQIQVVSITEPFPEGLGSSEPLKRCFCKYWGSWLRISET